MAFKEKDFTTDWMQPVRFPNGDNVNLAVISNLLQEEADSNGIPVAFREDTVKVGGMFSGQQEPILIMYNPQHATDYLRFALRVQHQGRYAFLHIYNLGGSKNYGHANAAAAGSTFRKMANAFGGHNSKLQAEEQYYQILQDCISNIVGG